MSAGGGLFGVFLAKNPKNGPPPLGGGYPPLEGGVPPREEGQTTKKKSWPDLQKVSGSFNC
jgi:hypothetical protein